MLWVILSAWAILSAWTILSCDDEMLRIALRIFPMMASAADGRHIVTDDGRHIVIFHRIFYAAAGPAPS